MIGAAELSAVLQLPPPTREQAEVIEAPLSPSLVVAGAGSGKTETMAGRVLFLVANQLVLPEQVLGLTFTRKAASGLAARIRRRLRTLAASGIGGPGGGGEPEVSTYHSFGGRLITEFGSLSGVEPASKVLSATGSWLLARRVVSRWDGDLQTDLGPDQVTERLLAMAGGLADHLTNAQELADEIESVLATLRSAPPSPTQRGPVHSGLVGYLKRLQDRAWILPLVDAFTQAKREAGVVDFADQMQVAAALVSAYPRIGQALRSRHAVVLLDEYQDTGHSQRVILRGVFAGADEAGRPSGHPVTAVGDPVQSIYSWRGASASNLPRFPADFPQRSGLPAATLTLSTSFRNAPEVLVLANEVSAIIRDGTVKVQELRARTGAGRGDVRYGLFGTVNDEEAWVADQIAVRWADAGFGQCNDPVSGTPPTTAVLMRRRRDMEPMAMALRDRGLPVEVVGLGGLLSEPEIADLVALLRVLVDPTAGPAALRLLTGARWQLGMADLAALSRRAGALAPRTGSGGAAMAPGGDAATEGFDRASGRDAVREALAGAVAGEEIDSASLIDAISDPGDPDDYSDAGFRRLHRLRGELTRLRGRLTLPLPDLMAELERTTGLDVEVCTNSSAGRAHLDAFADVVADFAAGGGSPVDLVDYLLTAGEREDGLTPGEVVSATGRVQILTVHAAKGLEWEIVAVPHLSDTVFPGSRTSTWLGDAAQLPPAVRGDSADLPQLTLPVGGDQKDMVAALAAHAADLKADQAVEERRLLYVAVTRAERVLLVSGHQWGRTGAKPRGPSDFLVEISSVAASFGPPDEWAERPADGSVNPLTALPRRSAWPVDPLGEKRLRVQIGADLVRTAIDRRRRSVADVDLCPAQSGSVPDVHGWSRDVAALLAERRFLRAKSVEVALPPSISATALVEMAGDPGGLARRIRRPVPQAPTPRARRGTAFHAWLERFFTASALLDISDLPGANDGGLGPDPEVEVLKVKFQASPWARRVPFEIELPFSMTIGGQPVRGRVDAVFRDDDGGCTVVDWKTGRMPSAAHRRAATVQLAVYRLAVADMLGLPITSVRAAFVYVATGETFAPADLLDAVGLGELVRCATTVASVAKIGPTTTTRSALDLSPTSPDDPISGEPDPEEPDPDEFDIVDDEIAGWDLDLGVQVDSARWGFGGGPAVA